MLDGATTPAPENAMATTPGVFAASWNRRTEEERQRWLDHVNAALEFEARMVIRDLVAVPRHHAMDAGLWQPPPRPRTLADDVRAAIGRLRDLGDRLLRDANMRMMTTPDALEDARVLYGSTTCHAGRDGECRMPCPQLRDGEPRRSGRHCPIDIDTEE